MTLPRSAADVLAGHVLFEIEAIDRMHLNLCQPRLQHGAGIAAFFVGHRGNRFASPALMAPVTAAFTADIGHADIGHFVAARGLDLVRFSRGHKSRNEPRPPRVARRPRPQQPPAPVTHRYISRIPGSHRTSGT
jgi:hypothetical protein